MSLIKSIENGDYDDILDELLDAAEARKALLMYAHVKAEEPTHTDISELLKDLKKYAKKGYTFLNADNPINLTIGFSGFLENQDGSEEDSVHFSIQIHNLKNSIQKLSIEQQETLRKSFASHNGKVAFIEHVNSFKE